MKTVLIGWLFQSAYGDDLTCQGVKDLYKANSCCGDPTKTITSLVEPSACTCAYDFTKPTCANAGVQAPRDLTDDSVGSKTASFDPLTTAQRDKLKLSNVHFHQGAEHNSAQYKDWSRRLGDAYDHDHDGNVAHTSDTAAHGHYKDLPTDSGRTCDTSAWTLDAYTFSNCQNVSVGSTYEIHWVHSSANVHAEVDVDDDEAMLSSGLGAAANGGGALNPFLAVKAQVVFIVNGGMADGSGDGTSKDPTDYHLDWHSAWATDVKRYAGSTTGPSHNNDDVCSPYAVSWFVDRECHAMDAGIFDTEFCGKMIEEGLHVDLWPHGSRTLVSSEFVVPWSDVLDEA